MNALVVYNFRFGNTEQIAQVIAATLSGFGEARAMRVDPTQPFECEGGDVLMLGCPTGEFFRERGSRVLCRAAKWARQLREKSELPHPAVR